MRASMAEGDKLAVDSTPTLFINGERFTGSGPGNGIAAALDRALADSAQQAPRPMQKTSQVVKSVIVPYQIAHGGDF